MNKELELSTANDSQDAPVKKKNEKKKGSQKGSKKKVVKDNKPVRNYPPITLEKSLVLAQKIKELNGGNPWDPNEVRKAANIGDTNKFFIIRLLLEILVLHKAREMQKKCL